MKVDKLKVFGLFGHELVIFAILDDLSMIAHIYHLRVSDGAESMSYRDRGSTIRGTLESIPYQPLGLGV